MKPLPAVGLASSLIQIIDFSVKTTRKDHKIFQPTEGNTPHVENHTLLQDVANHLNKLLLKLDINDLKKLSSDPKRGKLSEPAEHLLKISDEAKELGTTLVDAVLQAQARGSYGDPRWLTVREALMTVMKKKEITAIKKKFKNVRKEVEANLMIALRFVFLPAHGQKLWAYWNTDNILTSLLKRACLFLQKVTKFITWSGGRTKQWTQCIPRTGRQRTRKIWKNFQSKSTN